MAGMARLRARAADAIHPGHRQVGPLLQRRLQALGQQPIPALGQNTSWCSHTSQRPAAPPSSTGFTACAALAAFSCSVNRRRPGCRQGEASSRCCATAQSLTALTKCKSSG